MAQAVRHCAKDAKDFLFFPFLFFSLFFFALIFSFFFVFLGFGVAMDPVGSGGFRWAQAVRHYGIGPKVPPAGAGPELLILSPLSSLFQGKRLPKKPSQLQSPKAQKDTKEKKNNLSFHTL